MLDRPRNPFRGLSSFTEGATLFGRDRDLVLFQNRVHSARTTLLFAGSGVGKTSFLEAKVLPDLEQSGYWACHYRTWGTSKPFDELRRYVDERLLKLANPLLQRIETLLAGELALAEREQLFSIRARLLAPPSSSLFDVVKNRFACLNTDLAQVASLRGGQGPESSPPDRLVLILDQFEEVFQYHAYQDYFREFLDQLCAIINDRTLEVSVVLALREEYLGELSVFDNRVPDVFANHYRLRCPSWQEAAQIVTSTCAESAVKPNPAGLHALLHELAKVEVGAGTMAERPNAQPSQEPHVVERDFVAPPYLQLVCKAVWDSTPWDGAAKTPTFDYLAGYTSGTAANVLSRYCDDKLQQLGFFEQRLTARAFDFLVTQNGAKIAYQLRQLAELMGTTEKRLSTTLGTLSKPDTLILRMSPSPDGERWIELYHDMYGRIVHRWKTAFNLQFERGRAIVLTVLGCAVLVFVAQVFTARERTRTQQAETVKDQGVLAQADLEESGAFIAAKAAFTRLREHDPEQAARLWGSAWARRAQRAERLGDSGTALLYWLTALSVTKGTDEHTYRRAARRIVDSSYAALIATYRRSDLDGLLPAGTGPGGDSYFVAWSRRDVQLWSTGWAKPLETVTIPPEPKEAPPPLPPLSPTPTLEQWKKRFGTVPPPPPPPPPPNAGELGLEEAYVDGEQRLVLLFRPVSRHRLAWIGQASANPAGSAAGDKHFGAAFSLLPAEGELNLSRTADADFISSWEHYVPAGKSTVLLRHLPVLRATPENTLEQWPALGALHVSPTDTVVKSASGRLVAVWSPTQKTIDVFGCSGTTPAAKGVTPVECPKLRSILDFPGGLLQLAVSADGAWLAADLGSEVRVLSTNGDGKSWIAPRAVANGTWDRDPVALMGSGDRLSLGLRGTRYVWTSPENETRRMTVYGMLSDDGTVLLSQERERGLGVRAWNVRKMPRVPALHSIDEHQVFVQRTTLLSQNGTVWFTFDKDGFLIRETATGKTIGKLDRQPGGANGILTTQDLQAIDAQGQRVACVDHATAPSPLPAGEDLVVKIWDTAHLDRRVLELPVAGGVDVDFSPNGQLLARSNGERTTLLRISDGKVVLDLPVGSKNRDFSPDGRHLILTQEDGKVTVVSLVTDPAGGVITATNDDSLKAQPRTAFGTTLLAVSDGSMLFDAGSINKPELQLWTFDTKTTQELRLPTPVAVSRIALNRAGTLAVAVQDDHRLFVWQPQAESTPRHEFLLDGAPSNMFFGGDDRSLFVSIGSRIERLVVASDGTLAVDATRFFAGDVRDARPVGKSGSELRVVVYVDRISSLETAFFDDNPKDPELTGAPVTLLTDWQKRLGMNVDPRGVVVPAPN